MTKARPIDQKGLADAGDQIDPDGHLECGCVPGHRSSHLTHRCAVCGFSDADMENGIPVPPCKEI